MAVAELNWRTLTAVVNEMKSPNNFVRRLLFSNHIPVPTDNIEVSLLKSGRKIAPFVKKNGEALIVSGHEADFYNITPPNIRIKRPFTPSELLFERKVGTTIFQQGPDGISAAIRAHIARDMQVMSDDVVNSEEFLCCQAIDTGVVSYSVEGGDSFTVTFPRPAAHNVVLTTFWDDATPANIKIEEDSITAKRLISDEVGLQPTDVILGLEASTKFRSALRSTGILGDLKIDTGRLSAFVNNFNDDGVLYLGNLFGLDWWEYGRSVSVNGVDTPLIRSKYALFVTRSPAAQNVLYYGAISDMKTLRGRLFQAERFSKSWEVEDPSAMWALLASRPLPVTRRPGSIVSMKVVSG